MVGKGRKHQMFIHCNCLIRGELARPERFELPAFWFVARSAKTSKCRYWYRLRATRASLFCPQLDRSWTENLGSHHKGFKFNMPDLSLQTKELADSLLFPPW